MPSAIRNPSQNWCVDQILSTLGMPRRNSDRGFDRPEGFGANHLSDVRIGMFDFLNPGFHHPHFADILDEPLGTGIAADNALEALPDRDLAPWPPLGFGERHVDERSFA